MLLASLLGGHAGIWWPTSILDNLQDIVLYYKIMAIFKGTDPEVIRVCMQFIWKNVLQLAGVLLRALLLGNIVSLGMVRVGLETLDGAPVGVSMLFPRGFYWKALRLNLLRALLVFLWSLLLVVPGVIAAHSYAMAEYLLLQNPDMGVVEALRQSRKRMQGRRFSLLGMQLVFFGWRLLASLPGEVLVEHGTASYSRIAGAVLIWVLTSIVLPYKSTALAAFYRHVDAGEEILVQFPY